MQSLAEIKELLTAGKRDAAKRALLAFLHAEPDNVSAWALLATLLEEPEQQAKCYRRILHLDPDNREAAESLQQLARPSPPSETASSTVQGNVLRCPQCGGMMEVHFVSVSCAINAPAVLTAAPKWTYPTAINALSAITSSRPTC